MSANLLQVGSKRRRTKQQIADEFEASKRKEQKIAARMANYDVLEKKIDMMAQDVEKGKVATNLIEQFLDTGFVTTDDQGNFKEPGLSGEKIFKPFENQ